MKPAIDRITKNDRPGRICRCKFEEEPVGADADYDFDSDFDRLVKNGPLTQGLIESKRIYHNRCNCLYGGVDVYPVHDHRQHREVPVAGGLSAKRWRRNQRIRPLWM